MFSQVFFLLLLLFLFILSQYLKQLTGMYCSDFHSIPKEKLILYFPDTFFSWIKIGNFFPQNFWKLNTKEYGVAVYSDCVRLGHMLMLYIHQTSPKIGTAFGCELLIKQKYGFRRKKKNPKFKFRSARLLRKMNWKVSTESSDVVLKIFILFIFLSLFSIHPVCSHYWCWWTGILSRWI